MTVSPQFIKSVLQVATSAFRNAGWTRRKAVIFSVNLTEEAYGCVGLNKALYREGILELNPVVGVGNYRVEKLVAEMSGVKFEPYTTACIGTNVGYLMPEKRYTAWSFRDGDDCEALIAEMVAAVEKFGRPFMDRNATLGLLYNTLLNSKRGIPPDQLDYRIAVAAVLLGKHAEAEAFLDTKLREIGNRKYAAAEWFKNFAQKLRGYAA